MQASALSPTELGQGKTTLSFKLGVKSYAIDDEQLTGLKEAPEQDCLRLGGDQPKLAFLSKTKPSLFLPYEQAYPSPLQHCFSTFSWEDLVNQRETDTVAHM